MSKTKPATDWFVIVIPDGNSLDRPGIYEWQISDIAIYVGKSSNLRRRLREYPNNVRKMIAGLPYRRGKPTEYRVVHHHLRQARATALTVTVTILENCARDELVAKERHWIKRRRGEAVTGGPRVLNAD